MCGIVSLQSHNHNVTDQILANGLNAIRHRGPDGQNNWVSNDKSIGLGHARLSIIGIENGTQPLSSMDGSIRAVVNGELYGYKVIKEKLASKGYRFQTESDSEILIYLYKEYGTECLKHLRGEFSFILWDGKQKHIFAARDRFGIKPLCYSIQENGIYFASEAKAIFAMGVKPEWDHDSYFHAASMQYTPQDKTLFKGIDQLKPGHFVISKGGRVKVKKYWDLNYKVHQQQTTETHPATIEQFHDQLRNSISERMVADVPICFHLSGGLDSSAVIGMATHISGKSQTAFTVSFEHSDYDETKQAHETAAMLDADLNVVSVSQKDIVHALPDAVYQAEGTAINGHLAAKFLLNKAIQKSGFKVALTGEGADECLAGYPHLRQDLNGENNDLSESNTASLGVMMPYGDELPLDAVTKKLGYSPAFLKAKAGFGFRLQSILSNQFLDTYKGRDSFSDLIKTIDFDGQLKGRSHVDQSLYIWTKLALANYILRSIGDGVEMACSIEGRLPFLDHHLFEFIASLPLNYKINKGVEKYILREATKPYITNTIYKRQKHPFMAPPLVHFNDPNLNEIINDIVHSESFTSIPFFDAVKIKSALSKRQDLSIHDQKAFEPVLMTILTTAILHERFSL